ncbi:MFS transporter [Micrococcus luteus]|nr:MULTISPECIES: MFS transporter [Micrococcus]CVM88627.1 Proline porter II [Streptococcus pneumoniae]MCV7543075.1 MFS transporter [Micrococcus luteus]MCV7658250.1 MFS transporter [Micrococcus luteus]MCV7664279.1 MFS transporter [Micrococcus luteus]MCV7674270.1 MFS transporter [Micrococcus luteus]
MHLPETLRPGLPLSKDRRRRVAITASSVGTVIEWYDYMVYAFVAVTIAKVFFPSGDPAVAVLSALAVFGVSFLFRPLGGMLFGHIADRFGRRPALTISVIGMAGTSALMGVLPVYASVGLLAPILLVTLRAVQGVAAGGEMASAATYTAEASSDRTRAFDTSFVNLGLVTGTALGAVVTAVLYATLTDQQMLEWGWRVPFLLSVPMGLVAVFIRRHMEESEEFDRIDQADAVKKSPIREALTQAPRQVLLVTGLNLGSFAAYYIVFTYMSTYFQTQGILTASQASWSTVSALLFAGLSLPFWGRWADKVGRKPVFLIATGSLTLLAYPLFLMMKQGTGFAIGGQLIFGLLEGAYLGVYLSAYTELFTPALRVSGIALGYNISSIIAGGPAPYVSQWLIRQTGIAEAPAFFLIGMTGISFCVVLFAYRETLGRGLPGKGPDGTVPGHSVALPIPAPSV